MKFGQSKTAELHTNLPHICQIDFSQSTVGTGQLRPLPLPLLLPTLFTLSGEQLYPLGEVTYGLLPLTHLSQVEVLGGPLLWTQ